MTKIVTLAQAQAEVEAGMEEGVGCPCCGQLCKIYARKLNSNMVCFLLSLVYRSKATIVGHKLSSKWVHKDKCFYCGHDYPYLEQFGLARTKKRSGLWKPTVQGFKFAKGQIKVPRILYIFNNKIIRSSSELTTVRKALTDKFDYDELMAGIW